MKRFVWIIVIVLLTACQPRPVTRPLSVSTAQQLDVLRQLAYRQNSLSALAEVKVTQQGKHWSTTQGLLVERPLRLRVDAINFFGQLLFQMAVSGPDLQAYVPSDNQYYSGMATLDKVQRFTGLPLSVADLVASLLYSLPPGVLESGEVVAQPRGLDFVVAPGVRYEVEFTGRLLHRVCYRIDDYMMYDILYSKWGEDGFPRRIELSVDSSLTQVVIQFEDVEINPQIKAEKFQLTIPERAELMPLDEVESVDESSTNF
ncbi:DUF4292 domain-containing protein [Desulfuromonas acetoxidans]|uniref:LolA family protein n=1 Tax=Desulfuromonas acetoxidans TaxID=891 RepID=UPI00292F8F2B|nr:DUF4292 domain-containing protein [Desulfuromonas acetoxidans]